MEENYIHNMIYGSWSLINMLIALSVALQFTDVSFPITYNVETGNTP